MRPVFSLPFRGRAGVGAHPRAERPHPNLPPKGEGEEP
jgi:hypothetical protein